VFGGHATATGGEGESVEFSILASGGTADGGTGGTCIGGHIGIDGEAGGDGFGGEAATEFHMSGKGGNSQLGFGAKALGAIETEGQTGASAGSNDYGGGGSGAVNANDSTSRLGGDGADGVIIIWEIF
jgi:hypothetical protein